MSHGLPERELCCGCRTCEESCLKDAIYMEKDNRGHIYPYIDEKKCIKCGRCEKVCPINNPPLWNEDYRTAIVAVQKDKSILEQSSSGGAFSAVIAAWKPRYVSGVRWNKDFSVFNDISDDLNIIKLYSKSKYVMSDTCGIYKRVKGKISTGEKVLVSGTPCQIAGLRNYLGKDYENLFLVDIVCHGAPSCELLKKHIEELEIKRKKKIKEWTFRDKTPQKGKVSSRSARVIYSDGTNEHFEIKEDEYLKLYYSRLAYRESCSNCIFANPKRVSDITICDAHHIEERYPELSVEEGASVVLFHTQKANNIKEALDKYLSIYSIEYDWVIEHNEQLKVPTRIHPKTELFYQQYDKNKDFGKAVEIALHKSIIRKLCSKIYRMVRSLVGYCFTK